MMHWIDSLVAVVGRLVAWLLPVMVAITVLIVILRYGFDLGWIWLQELVIYLHAAVFMLTLAWTYGQDGHVRVDVVSQRLGARSRDWIELMGIVLLLLPFCVFAGWISWDYVAGAWRLREGSRQAGGLEFVFLLKALILIMPLLLGLQAVARAGHCLGRLRAG